MSNSGPPNVDFWALRALRKENNTCNLAAIRLQPLCTVSSKEFRMWKCKLLAPDSGDAYERNDFNKPRLLHPPIHRKELNSLTWSIWFSLIHKNTFDVETTCPLFRNFCITWLLQPTPTFLGQWIRKDHVWFDAWWIKTYGNEWLVLSTQGQPTSVTNSENSHGPTKWSVCRRKTDPRN